MDYIGHIFRPPSEAESLLLQVTVGCSHNGCTYCGMYRDPVQRFRMKPLDVVAQDVEEAAVYDRDVEPIRRVFLCDGDALVLPTKARRCQPPRLCTLRRCRWNHGRWPATPRA